MPEQIFNLFLFIEGGLIERLGVVVHQADGSDTQKIHLLQSAVYADFTQARIFDVPDRFRVVSTVDGMETQLPGRLSYPGYEQLSLADRHMELFEEIFDALGASPDPLSCITPIVDGEPRVDVIEGFGIGPLT